MSQVTMNAGNIGGLLQLPFSGNIQVPASGLIVVDSRDTAVLLSQGAQYINQRTISSSFLAPRAGTAGEYVASTAFANGTLSIANQPDVPRRGAIRIDPGTSAITAGNVAVSYVGNDGVATIDNLSAITAASTLLTQSTSKGIIKLSSVVVTGAAGGTSPAIQMDETNSLAPLVDPGFSSFVALKGEVDGTNDTAFAAVSATVPCVTWATAPNGTHNFTAAVSFNASSVE